MIESEGSSRARLNRVLEEELAALESKSLRRDTSRCGREGRVDLVSNDYLGLARDPRLVAALERAAREHGAGSGAARLLGGGALHTEVEASIARWLRAESALFFPSGFQANLGVIGGLFDRRDAIVSDELNHASIVDACRSSRSRVEIYRHVDLASLERALIRVAGARRIVVVTESVFGMDGDLAPLLDIHALCERFGALLLIDEAHALGVLGDEGRGAWSDVVCNGSALLGRIVTGGKALGVAGGFFVGDAAVRETLVHRARSFVFTTAAPPALAGALRTAIELVRGAHAERARVRELARRLAAEFGLAEPAAAIVPFVIGDSAAALSAAERCQAEGLDVRAVRPPTVPEGTARLRVSLHAKVSDAEVDRLIAVLREVFPPQRRSRAVASESPPAAIVVVGTDTGVGKTVASALLCLAYRARGEVAYFKPVQTGDECDTTRVAELAGFRRGTIGQPGLWFQLPASPHTAAKAEGRSIDECAVEAVIRERKSALPPGGRLVVELAGGLLVPYRLGFDQGDLLRRLGYPVVLIARSGLGTLNHTSLSIEALERRGQKIAALLLVGEAHAANAATLRALNPAVPIVEVPLFEPLDHDALARWLAAEPALLDVLP